MGNILSLHLIWMAHLGIRSKLWALFLKFACLERRWQAQVAEHESVLLKPLAEDGEGEGEV